MVEINFPQHLAAHVNKAIDASMTNEPTATRAVQEGIAVRVAGNDEIYPASRPPWFSTRRSSHASVRKRRSSSCAPTYEESATTTTRSQVAACGSNADEVVSILTQYTFIKDPNVHRQITPPAIDPDGRLGLDSLRKRPRILQGAAPDRGPRYDGREDHRSLVRGTGAKQLGPYKPRGE